MIHVTGDAYMIFLEFGLVSVQVLDDSENIILDIIINGVFASVMRSREGLTIDMFKNTQSVTTNFEPTAKRKGFLGLGLFAK